MSPNVTELFNLLINPEHHEFALRWHRDDVPETATLGEETEILKTNFFGVGIALIHCCNSLNGRCSPCLRCIH